MMMRIKRESFGHGSEIIKLRKWRGKWGMDEAFVQVSVIEKEVGGSQKDGGGSHSQRVVLLVTCEWDGAAHETKAVQKWEIGVHTCAPTNVNDHSSHFIGPNRSVSSQQDIYLKLINPL